MRSSLVAILFALFVSSCRCGTDTQTGFGDLGIIYVDAAGITMTAKSGKYDFHGVAMGVSRHVKVTVKNLGRGPLDLETLEKAEGEDPPVFTIDFSPTTLRAGESVELDAVFNAPFDTMAQSVPHHVKYQLTAGNTEEGKTVGDVDLDAVAVTGACMLPDTLDFGGVAVGDTATRSVRLENFTSLPTTATVGVPASASGDHLAFGFTSASAKGAVQIPSGESRDVVLTFRPTQTQSYVATVKLRAAEHCAEVTVKLIGTGVTSALDCAPKACFGTMGCAPPLDFGFLPPGLNSALDYTLVNYSLTDVSLTALATGSAHYGLPGGATLTVPAATRVDGPGGAKLLQPGTADVHVTFTPMALGPLMATLSAATSLMSQPRLSCALTGQGGGPDIDLKPTGMLDVGEVPYFANPPQPFFVTRKVTIQNLGTSPTPPDLRANLKLGASGVAPPFWRVLPKNGSLASEICVGEYDAANPNPALRCSNAPAAYDPMLGIQALGTRALLDVPIRITPSGPSRSMEWDVEFLSNDPDEPVVTLTVRAHSTTLPPCNYLVTPASVAFGLVEPPHTRDLSFSVKNLGTTSSETCLITYLDLAPAADPEFSLPDGPLSQRTLMPQEVLTVNVRVTPQGVVGSSVRQALGAVRFGISSPTAPQRDVPLTASIALACLTIAPDDLDFGTVKRGCDSSRRVFSVYNTCATPVTINSWRMSAPAGQPAMGPDCPGATPCPEFLLDGMPGFTMGQMVMPGAAMPLTFALKYHPIDYGPDTGAFLLDVTQVGARVDQLVTLRGTGDMEGKNTDTFAQDVRPKADVLWIVDSSCSMADKQTLLSQNFAGFIQYATSGVAGGVDYQMGVIDSDPTTATAGKLRGDMVNPKVLKSTMSNVEAMFRAKVVVGISGSGDEHFSDLAVKALTAPLITQENAGFMRPDAVLAVIAVTDAGDQSQLPTAVIIGLLQNIKGAQRPTMFSYNVIGPFAPSPPPGCNYDDYTDTTVHRAMTQAFGGIEAQICNQQWATALQDIGKTAFGYRDRFYLSSPPDLTRMPIFEVKLDGVPLPEMNMTGTVWSYDAPSNSMHFESLYVPEPGQTLTISYYVACP